MSNYCFNPTQSYGDWLTAKRFVRDITDGQEAVELTVSRQTREIVASLDELARENITAIEDLAGDVREGFERLEFGLADVSAGIRELNAQFHWGFAEMIAGIGALKDSLKELISIAKTPAQTWAYNQYEIARDAIRRRLWPEALQALDRAINGLGDNPGYPLEFRFHHSKGMIYLGNFRNADPSVVNLSKAEEAFLAAARYAKADYPLEAGMSFLAAGWAAYCQGKMAEAEAHTKQAVALHPRLGEGFFQLAKVAMHQDSPTDALPHLRNAIELDHLYAIKSLADGDFQGHEDILRSFLEQLRGDVIARADHAIEIARSWIAATREWRDLAAFSDTLTSPAAKALIERVARGSSLLETAIKEQSQRSLLSSLMAEKAATDAVRLAQAIIEELRAEIISTVRGILDHPTTSEHAPNASRVAREALHAIEKLCSLPLKSPDVTDAERADFRRALVLSLEASKLAQGRRQEVLDVNAYNMRIKNSLLLKALSMVSALFVGLGSVVAVALIAYAVTGRDKVHPVVELVVLILAGLLTCFLPRHISAVLFVIMGKRIPENMR